MDRSRLRRITRIVVAVAAAVCIAGVTFPRANAATRGRGFDRNATSRTQAMRARYAHLPISFEVNRGQVDGRVAFLAHTGDSTLFLTPSAAVLSLARPVNSAHDRMSAMQGLRPRVMSQPASYTRATVALRYAGANPHPDIVGLDRLPGHVNYFIGKDPKGWHTNIPTYARVEYQNIYPHIDLVFYGKAGHLEYDWIVHPGGDPRQIALWISGAKETRLDRAGNLVLVTGAGSIVQPRPVSYQQAGSVQRTVSVRYQPRSGRLRLLVGNFDPSANLVIDPSLVYSSYLGGSNQTQGNGIAVDAAGDAYITGSTTASNFPTRNPLQPHCGGTCSWPDVFVTEIGHSLSAAGAPLVYSTYLGGSDDDAANAIAIDAAGDAYLTGYTHSTDFPLKNPMQSGLNGAWNAFVSEIAPGGSALVYSTYLGGSAQDDGYGIALDAQRDAYITGETTSPDFPTRGALQPACGGGNADCHYGDAFVSEINPSGGALVYSTYLGGTHVEQAFAIAVDSAGDAYVTGITGSTDFPLKNPIQSTCLACPSQYEDDFVSEITAGGGQLVYSTYLGGSDETYAYGIAVDSHQDAYVVGFTIAPDFPIKNAFQPSCGGCPGFSAATVSEIRAGGGQLVYSTYLGGTHNDAATAVAVEGAGDLFVTGYAHSNDFPLKNAFPQVCSSGINCGIDGDAFVTEFNAAGSALVFSTLFGGSKLDTGTGIAVNGAGDAYVAGQSSSANFPTQEAFQPVYTGSEDAFVARISIGG